MYGLFCKGDNVNHRKILILIITSAVISMLFVGNAIALTTNYAPSRDTTIVSGTPDLNYESNEYLFVAQDNGGGFGIERFLLVFQLSKLKGKFINRVRLRLAYSSYLSDTTDLQSVSVYNVTNNSGEYRMYDTWNSFYSNNSYVVDSKPAATAVVGGTQNKYVYWDVTTLVKSWMVQQTQYYNRVLLKADNEQATNGKAFKSKDFPDADLDRPLLIVSTDSSRPVTYAKNTSARRRSKSKAPRYLKLYRYYRAKQLKSKNLALRRRYAKAKNKYLRAYRDSKKQIATARLKWKVSDTFSENKAKVIVKVDRKVISRPHKRRKDIYYKKYKAYKAKYKKTKNRRLRKRYLDAADKYFKAYRKTNQYKYIQVKRVNYGLTTVNKWRTYKYKARWAGNYRYHVYATDQGNNKQQNIARGSIRIK